METLESVMKVTMPSAQSLTITFVFDNNPYDHRLKSAWGFSALVEYHDHTLLFDTGGEGQILIDNMRIVGIDPTQIESVVLSHAHGDHIGGMSALFQAGARPKIYLTSSFPDAFKRQVVRTVKVIEVTPGLLIAHDLHSTGEMGSSIREQALVIQTDQGLVIVTGCAHPGIVKIVEQSQRMFYDRVHMVLGGFHLGGKSEGEIEAILKDFRSLGIEQVGPCHCTGADAIAMFAKEYGENFMHIGVGSAVSIDLASQSQHFVTHHYD
jgi:7,8-dihydropterin-6-yl-methyl-4-(beta-D-ribofuranosyl)aminobenzene 5'-phosphate synthase